MLAGKRHVLGFKNGFYLVIWDPNPVVGFNNLAAREMEMTAEDGGSSPDYF